MAFNWSFRDCPGEARLPQGGQLFGGHRLVRVLGEGAMGRVYEAEDTAGRRVALKVHKGVLNETGLARFQREGEIVASLEHPGIVKILAAGVDGGLPFQVYQLVEGARPLNQELRARPLRDRVELLARVAEAVGHAHAHGVVHRDLKAENVLVDAGGRPRVMDFGVAKALGAASLTRTGALVGTPLSMSPEQISGQLDLVGPHTDVWALGVMAYEALCGRVPFGGTTLVELQAAILGVEPEPPSSSSSEVSSDLDAVVGKALEKVPEDRYPDAAALAADLRACSLGERPSVSTLSSRALPVSGRSLIGLAAVAAVALGVVGAIAATGAEPRVVEPPAPKPVVPAADAGADPEREREAAKAFRALGRIEDPQSWMAKARTLVARYPDHEFTPEVSKRLAREQLEYPARVLRLEGRGSAYGFFVDGGIATVGGGEVAFWTLEGKQVSAREARGPSRGVFEATVAGRGIATCPNEGGPARWFGREREVDLPSAVKLVGSPDGRWVAAVTALGQPLRVHATDDWSVAFSLPHTGTAWSGAAFSPSGDRIAVFVGQRKGILVSGREGFFVHRLPSGERIGEGRIQGLARAGAFTRGGSLLVGGITGDLHDLELSSGRLLRRVTRPDEDQGFVDAAHRGAICGMASAADGRIYTAGYGRSEEQNELLAWTSALQLVARIQLRGRPLALDLSPDGEWLLISGRGGSVQLWKAPREGP